MTPLIELPPPMFSITVTSVLSVSPDLHHQLSLFSSVVKLLLNFNFFHSLKSTHFTTLKNSLFFFFLIKLPVKAIYKITQVSFFFSLQLLRSFTSNLSSIYSSMTFTSITTLEDLGKKAFSALDYSRLLETLTSLDTHESTQLSLTSCTALDLPFKNPLLTHPLQFSL